ncbi:MAG TPA: hypothetical protein EYN66_08885 [Myxococcales bacterium]|nr:hypothetical protein [Myxococcales bacterium]
MRSLFIDLHCSIVNRALIWRVPMKKFLQFLLILLLAASLIWWDRARTPKVGDSTEAATDGGSALSLETEQPDMPPISEDRPLPGAVFEVELIEEPAKRYNAGQATEADKTYAAVLAQLGLSTAIYDNNLGHAARELAYQHSIMDGLVPAQVVDFLLRSAGAIDKSVTQAFMSTTGSGIEAIRKRLQTMLVGLNDSEIVRIGVGEVYVPGPRPKHFIAVLMSRRRLEISPTPRWVQMGARWQMTGVLPRGFEKPSALLLGPEGGLVPLDLTHDGRRFAVIVNEFQTPGEMHVSVSAEGPFGPQPLIQLPVQVGAMPPNSLTIHLPPDETHIQSNQAAETLAFKLLNLDRAHFELPILILDPELSSVARRHSMDMRDNNFFGHISLNSGGPGDRLANAEYRASTYAENVAMGGSLHGAEQGLLKSLGHRKNILNAAFTHVGIGVAGKRDNGRMQWFLTQMFSKPVAQIDENIETKTILDKLNDVRRRNNLTRMRLDDALTQIAVNGANRVAKGASDVAVELLDMAKRQGLTRRGAYISVQMVVDPQTIKIPKEFLNGQYKRVGVGVVQLPDHPQGLIGVVILVAG